MGEAGSGGEEGGEGGGRSQQDFLDNVFVASVDVVEDLEQVLTKQLPALAVHNGRLRLVVIDSIAAVFRADFDNSRGDLVRDKGVWKCAAEGEGLERKGERKRRGEREGWMETSTPHTHTHTHNPSSTPPHITSPHTSPDTFIFIFTFTHTLTQSHFHAFHSFIHS